MTAPGAGDMTCPKCGHSNPSRSDYCWECRFDFVPDDRPAASPSRASPPPPISPPIPPPYSRTPAARAEPGGKARRETVSVYAFTIELVVSAIIVGGSWYLVALASPSPSVLYFLAGWAAVLLLVVLSEGRLPDPETDVSKYWSMNPFEFRDDRNRFVLQWHLILFLPRIVLRTLRRGFALLSTSR